MLKKLIILSVFVLLSCTITDRPIDDSPLLIEDEVLIKAHQTGYFEEKKDSLRGKIRVEIDNYSNQDKKFVIIIGQE